MQLNYFGGARRSNSGATALADLEGSSWIDIDAPIERCFDIIADVERAPEWQGAMQKAQALERDAQGRPVLVETHIHAIVANVVSGCALTTSSQPACAGRANGVTSSRCPALGNSRTVAAAERVRLIHSRSD